MGPRTIFAPGIAAAALLASTSAALAQQASPPPNAVSSTAPGAGTIATDADLIVVTGSAAPVRFEEIGNTLTVIDGATIERKNIAYLQDILREVPGVSISQSGSFGALSRVNIRGAEGNHTLVLIDNIEVASTGEGEFDFSALLANNIERIEVLRGPQSGLYGSNALGGVINVITRGGEGPMLDAATEAGNYGTLMGRGAVTVGDRETFLTASGIVRSTDGISSAATGTEDDGDRNGTGYVRGGLEIGPIARLDGSFRLVDKHTQTDGFDFSGGPQQGLAIDDDSFSDTQDVSGGVALTVTPSANLEGVLTASYSSHDLTGGMGGAVTFGSAGDRLKLGQRVILSFATGPALSHVLTAFTDYEEETYRNTLPVDPTQIAEQARDLLGLGLEYRLDLFDRLFLKAAVRHDDNSMFADATSYSLTGSWVVGGSGTRVHASYGTGVTNPTFYEQFGFIPGLFVGNPDLAPERAEGFDIGVEQRLGDRLLLDLTYFKSTLEDEIVSLFPSVANDAGESDREGVEFAARADLGWINLGGTYTFLDATDPDGTREVSRPKHQASVDATAFFGPRAAGDERRGSVTLGAIYNGEVLDNDFRNYFTNGFVAEKSPLDGYVLLRAAASYTISDTLQLFGRVENVLDEDYQQVISYGTPGLSAYGGVRLILP